MSKRVQFVLIGLVCFLLGCVVTQGVFLHGQVTNVKKPVWQYGLDMKARKGGETEWKDARNYGVEVFRDENNGNLVYISETGSISVMPGK